jgi:hypothetical protein
LGIPYPSQNRGVLKMFANFHSVNISSMTDFRLTTVIHLIAKFQIFSSYLYKEVQLASACHWLKSLSTNSLKRIVTVTYKQDLSETRQHECD